MFKKIFCFKTKKRVLKLEKFGDENFKKQYYKKALDYYSKGIDLALELKLRKDNNNLENYDTVLSNLYIKRGSTKLNLKLFMECIVDFCKSIDLNKNPKAYYSVAVVHEINNENEKALFNLNKAVDLDKEFFLAFYTRAVIKSKLGRFDESLNDLEIALKLQEDFPSFILKGDIYFDEKRDFVKAEECYSNAIRLKPEQDWYVYFKRGKLRTKLKIIKDAISDFNKAVELIPDDPQFDEEIAEIYNKRGCLKLILYQFKGSVDDFNLAIKHFPKLVDAFKNRGNAFNEMKCFNKAIVDFNKYIEANENDSKGFSGRGIGKMNTKKYEEAIDDFTTAITLQPTDWKSYKNRSFVKKKLNLLREANKDLANAIKLNPNCNLAFFQRNFEEMRYAHHKKFLDELDFSKDRPNSVEVLKSKKREILLKISSLRNEVKTLDSLVEDVHEKESTLCRICFCEKVSFVFIPCGHLFCERCSKKMKKCCPFCRRKDVEVNKLFFN